MSTLVLVRHGETAWNAERRLQGREDIELSRGGREQAVALRESLHALRPTHVVCSPLARARETLALTGLTADRVDADWQEADLGHWTGRRSDELVAAGAGYREWRAGRLAPPGGERLCDIEDRVRQALAGLPREGTVLVVTHGGPIRAACSALVGLASSHLVPVLPGSLTSFDVSGPQARLLSLNVTPRTVPVPGHRAEESD